MENILTGAYFPILVDMKHFNSLVIGAGNIASRKVLNLLEFNASVTVLAPEISEEISEIAAKNKIKIIQREYKTGDIKGYNLVFCATGKRGVDEMVYNECQKGGVLLNVADVPALCNFIMPATLKRGDLTISVASQGKSPFYVRETKKKLEDYFPEITADITSLAGELRKLMIESDVYKNVEIREKIIDEFFKIDFELIIREEGKMAAKGELVSIIQRYI